MRWLDGITDSMDVSLSDGVGDGQGCLACCNCWGRKESDMTELLTELTPYVLVLFTYENVTLFFFYFF